VLKEFEEPTVCHLKIPALNEQFLRELGFDVAERHTVSVSGNEPRTVE
jgi:hypothetical protein